MASDNIVLYAEKRYELEEIRHKLNEEFYKHRLGMEFAREIRREVGETKTLLLIYERYFGSLEGYGGLAILISEYHGYQGADVVAMGARKYQYSAVEDKLVKYGKEALQNIGFQSKT